MNVEYSRRAAILLCLVSMLYITCAVACDILAFKAVMFWSIPIIGSSLIFPLTYAFMDFISEIYGNYVARIVIWFHVFCDFLFTYVIYWVVHLPSPIFWHDQEAYNTVVDPMTRLYMSNLLGVIMSALLNIFVLRRLRIFTKGKYYGVRSFMAMSISITVYTFFTNIFAYGPVYSHQVFVKITSVNMLTNFSCAFIYACILSVLLKPVMTLFNTPNMYKTVSLFEK
jgi:uncharacterized integral membrane protein (TIGR00697 family)